MVIVWLGGTQPNLQGKPPRIAHPRKRLEARPSLCNPSKHMSHFLQHRCTYGKDTREIFGVLFPQLIAGVLRFWIFPSVLEKNRKECLLQTALSRSPVFYHSSPGGNAQYINNHRHHQPPGLTFDFAGKKKKKIVENGRFRRVGGAGVAREEGRHVTSTPGKVVG